MNIFRLTQCIIGSLAVVQMTHAVIYHYDGDTLPTVGTYAGWFTTVGPGHPTDFYFANTTWSSNGSVLQMNTVAPGEGIWFGRTSGYFDASNFDLASTADGNIAAMRAALSPSATEWSLYYNDTDGYGSSFYLLSNGVQFSYIDNETSQQVDQFLPIADMTAFHTYKSYVLAGQVSYFVDGNYVGGGGALTGGTSNFLLIGDGSARTHTGTGSMFVDYLTIETAPLAFPSIPEPKSLSLTLGLISIFALTRRRDLR